MSNLCEIFDIITSDDYVYTPIIKSKLCNSEKASLIEDEYDFESYVEDNHLNKCLGINFNPSYNHRGTRIFPDDVINHLGTIVIDEKYKERLRRRDITKLMRDKKASNSKYAFFYTNYDIKISPTRFKQLEENKISVIKTCVVKFPTI